MEWKKRLGVRKRHTHTHSPGDRDRGREREKEKQNVIISTTQKTISTRSKPIFVCRNCFVYLKIERFVFDLKGISLKSVSVRVWLDVAFLVKMIGWLLAFFFLFGCSYTLLWMDVENQFTLCWNWLVACFYLCSRTDVVIIVSQHS